MSMFSFQAIHNTAACRMLKSSVVYRLCQCSLFKQFTTFYFRLRKGVWLFIDYVNVLFSSNSQLKKELPFFLQSCLSIMSMFSFQAIHNISPIPLISALVVYRLCQCSLFKQFTTIDPLFLFLSGCLSIMSMFSFQAIHNHSLLLLCHNLVVYRLCQCSLFKQFTTSNTATTYKICCLSIMSMFSFQAIHNEPSRFIFRCKGTFFFGQCQIFFSRG